MGTTMERSLWRRIESYPHDGTIVVLSTSEKNWYIAWSTGYGWFTPQGDELTLNDEAIVGWQLLTHARLVGCEDGGNEVRVGVGGSIIDGCWNSEGGMEIREIKLSETQPICIMKGVRDYSEGYPVELAHNDHGGPRLVVRTFNEGGYNNTEVDLFDLLEWAERNRDLIEREYEKASDYKV